MQVIHITANSRLTLTLKQQAERLAARQAQASKSSDNPKSDNPNTCRVTESPQIMTLSQWWAQWQAAILLRGGLEIASLPTKVLNTFEAQWLWEQVLEEELLARERAVATGTESDGEIVQSLALLNVASTAKQLYQAWLLSKNWFPEDWLEQPFLSKETLLYKACQARYLAKLTDHNWQDEALAQAQQLQWLRKDKGPLPSQFVLHGFDEFTPQMKAWQTAVKAHGCQVVEQGVSADSEETLHQFYTASDLQDEVQQVALWGLKQWQKLSQLKPHNDIKIGIISPNLADYKVALTQTLDEQLSLNGRQALNSHRSAPPFYNLSLGTPLLELPLVKNAWLALSLFLQPNKPCRYSDWSQWLVSPYTQENFIQRQQADSAFRRLQWAQFRWPKLIETDTANSLPLRVKTSLQTLAGHSLPNKLSLSDFVQSIWLVLDTIGWPGNRPLNSDEFQQKTIFEGAIEAFSTVTGCKAKQSVAAWLSLFRRFASEQLHQSQSKGLQPIQVMGMLEAGGQTFDALWILGLTDEAWPRMSSPNPFLPMAEQRAYRSPRCDAKRELEYADLITQRLINAAPEMVWSYAKHEGDSERLMSPIIERLQQDSRLNSEVTDYVPAPYQSLAAQVFEQRSASKPIDWVLDAKGPEVEIGSKAPGGTGILQAQSQCPLMAFMDFRLGGKYSLQTVDEGIQNNNQGTLVHKVLELFWIETKTQVALLTLSEEAIIARLNQYIEQAFEGLDGAIDAAFVALEQSRILALCFDWLNLEKLRSSFEVLETEGVYENIILAGIQFKVIIDRIDKVEGDRVIIDYKTGKANISNLLKTPTKAPQLAVYLHALSETVAGIGYGILHADTGVKMSAITSEESVLYKARSIQVFAKMAEDENNEFYETTWEHFLGHLEQQVEDLASDIQMGSAPMDYDSEADIMYANCKLALRLPEVTQQLQAFRDSFKAEPGTPINNAEGNVVVNTADTLEVDKG